MTTDELPMQVQVLPMQVQVQVRVQRAADAVARAEVACRRAAALVEDAKRIRDRCRSRSMPRYFVVHGEIDGTTEWARWSHGTLSVSEPLRQRAHMLIGLNEVFDGGQSVIEADLESAFPALLTLIRSCDEVKDLRFGPGMDDRPTAVTA